MKSLFKKIYSEMNKKRKKNKNALVQIDLNGFLLNVNPNHTLITNNLEKFPYMNMQLIRIAQKIREKQGSLTFIDIGANIGDTTSLILDKHESNKYLCVEGNKKYFEILVSNLGSYSNVFLEQIFLSDNNEKTSLQIDEHNGSASLNSTLSSENQIQLYTLDHIINSKYPQFKNTNFLKIDTDGFDYKILRGSIELLKVSKPVIFFELEPPHLECIGNENAFSIFEYLKDLGYTFLLFYDNTGYPILNAKITDSNIIHGLINYAKITDKLFYDVLAVHQKFESDFFDFYQQEIINFKMPHSLYQGKFIAT